MNIRYQKDQHCKQHKNFDDIIQEKMEKFMGKLHRYGDWFAFFSFLPGIGDVIAVASGYFRCRWWIVALSMLLGKFVRYIVWMYLNGLIM